MTLLWDIANSSGATLSAGGTTATIDNNVGPGQGGIRGNIGWDAGLRYFELGIVLFDGVMFGVTSSNANNFPGNQARGAGYANNGSFAGLWQNWGGGSTNGGAGGPLLNAPTRVGVMLNIDTNVGQFISADHPVGTDIYTFSGLWGGAKVYPSVGTGFGGGASHVCSAIIYGNESDFTVTRPASYLAWTVGANASNFFALL